ncbi:hypothetical protein BC629DRAFT_1594476 [Irpex lacteus]|nr:hypothetical protein BC629DRAFT_1594476 [Irpex lacteus]
MSTGSVAALSMHMDDVRAIDSEFDSIDALSPNMPSSPSRFKLHGPRAKPNRGSTVILETHVMPVPPARASSFQVQSTTSIKSKRRHTLVLEPTRSLPPIPAEVMEGRHASAEELEAAKWRDEVVQLMLNASGHKEIQEGLEQFQQREMPPLVTTPSPESGLPTLVTCGLPSVCSCGPCLRAERESKNYNAPNVRSPL